MPDLRLESNKEEARDDYSEDLPYEINSWGADLSFRELVTRYEENTLAKPEMQRKYVWDRVEASRFVESVLLGLPIPSIFLSKTGHESHLIVDGYQRIMTMRDYIRGVFSGDKKPFHLSRSERIGAKWRGKMFSELSESEQRRIKNTTIHTIIFSQQSPSNDDTSMYQVFERINTSGRSLLPQEIRNCIFQGQLNTLLIELNLDSQWRRLLGTDDADSRMRDIELVLRYLALGSADFKNENKERISLKRFLTLFMKRHRHLPENEAESIRRQFKATVGLIHDTFGTGAFRKFSTLGQRRSVSQLSPTILDSIMLATDRHLQASPDGPNSSDESKRRALLVDQRYKKAISQETMRVETIRTRVDIAFSYLYTWPSNAG